MDAPEPKMQAAAFGKIRFLRGGYVGHISGHPRSLAKMCSKVCLFAQTWLPLPRNKLTRVSKEL